MRFIYNRRFNLRNSLLIDTNSSVDWALRHGRGIALGIALKESAEKIWIDQYQTGVKKSINSLVESDRVRSETEYVGIWWWFEPPHDKTNKMACAPSKDSDQPGHPPSLISVFAVRMKKAWVHSYPLSAQQRLWSDWADARLIWVFTGHTVILLVLSFRINFCCSPYDIMLWVLTTYVFMEKYEKLSQNYH